MLFQSRFKSMDTDWISSNKSYVNPLTNLCKSSFRFWVEALTGSCEVRFSFCHFHSDLVIQFCDWHGISLIAWGPHCFKFAGTPIFNLKDKDEHWQGWSEARCAVKGLWGQPQVLRVGGQGGQCQWLPEIDLAVRRNSQSRNPNSTSAPNKDMTQPLINCQKTLKNNRLQTPEVPNNRLQIQELSKESDKLDENCHPFIRKMLLLWLWLMIKSKCWICGLPKRRWCKHKKIELPKNQGWATVWQIWINRWRRCWVVLKFLQFPRDAAAFYKDAFGP